MISGDSNKHHKSYTVQPEERSGFRAAISHISCALPRRRTGARELVADAVLAGAKVGLLCCTASLPSDDVASSVRGALGPGLSANVASFVVPTRDEAAEGAIEDRVREASSQMKRELTQQAAEALSRELGAVSGVPVQPSMLGEGARKVNGAKSPRVGTGGFGARAAPSFHHPSANS